MLFFANPNIPSFLARKWWIRLQLIILCFIILLIIRFTVLPQWHFMVTVLNFYLSESNSDNNLRDSILCYWQIEAASLCGTEIWPCSLLLNFLYHADRWIYVEPELNRHFKNIVLYRHLYNYSSPDYPLLSISFPQLGITSVCFWRLYFCNIISHCH